MFALVVFFALFMHSKSAILATYKGTIFENYQTSKSFVLGMSFDMKHNLGKTLSGDLLHFLLHAILR